MTNTYPNGKILFSLNQQTLKIKNSKNPTNIFKELYIYKIKKCLLLS